MGRTQKSQDFQKLHLRNLQVHVDNHQKALPIRKRFIKSLVKEILGFLNISCLEISIYFTTDKKISKLHADFFNDPTTTDCITFPIDEEYLGEIFVCPSVALDYAKKHNKCPLEETILYLVHGILHLIGYDDLDPKSKKTMRRMEKKCMTHISEVVDIKELIK